MFCKTREVSQQMKNTQENAIFTTNTHETPDSNECPYTTTIWQINCGFPCSMKWTNIALGPSYTNPSASISAQRVVRSSFIGTASMVHSWKFLNQSGTNNEGRMGKLSGWGGIVERLFCGRALQAKLSTQQARGAGAGECSRPWFIHGLLQWGKCSIFRSINYLRKGPCRHRSTDCGVKNECKPKLEVCVWILASGFLKSGGLPESVAVVVFSALLFSVKAHF